MTVRRLKRMLLGTALIFFAGSVAVLGWGVVAPFPQPSALPPSNRPEKSTESAPLDNPVSGSQDWANLVDRRLRPPLFDESVSEASAAPKVAPAQIPIQLVGTIIERGKSLGIFRVSGTDLQIRGIGEHLGEGPTAAEVVAVDQSQARLRVGATTYTLSLVGSEDGQ